MASILRKPNWIRARLPSGTEWRRVDEILKRRGLHTVCDEARCPNKGECWGGGTATFMILGDVCTRGCRFCAVATGRHGRSVRPEEAEELAEAVAELGLKYAVITSVDRDDLADRGAGHFAACLRAIKTRVPRTRVEVLIPDYFGPELRSVLEAQPDVVAHNVETVRRLQGIRDGRASFDTSLRTLSEAKAAGVPLTKSSLLLGLGEGPEEVYAAMDDLRGVGVDVLVMGQYLRPSQLQIEVREYVEPAVFDEYARIAREKGFRAVVSAPFARTSYHAMQAYEARTAPEGKDDLGGRKDEGERQ